MATNTMRRGKTLLILFMVFALCSTMASAATTVEIIPSSKTVAQGGVFTVDLNNDGFVNVKDIIVGTVPLYDSLS